VMNGINHIAELSDRLGAARVLGRMPMRSGLRACAWSTGMTISGVGSSAPAGEIGPIVDADPKTS
jgi:hypothetical protein